MEVPKESKPWLNSDTMGFVISYQNYIDFQYFLSFWHWGGTRKLLNMEKTQKPVYSLHNILSWCASVPETAQGVSNLVTWVLSLKQQWYSAQKTETILEVHYQEKRCSLTRTVVHSVCWCLLNRLVHSLVIWALLALMLLKTVPDMFKNV